MCERKSLEGDRRRTRTSKVWETREVFELKAGGRRELGDDRQARREGVRVGRETVAGCWVFLSSSWVSLQTPSFCPLLGWQQNKLAGTERGQRGEVETKNQSEFTFVRPKRKAEAHDYDAVQTRLRLA